MRLAVISDTHLSGPDEAFQTLYGAHLAPAPFLLHCGDMVGASVYHYLCRHRVFCACAATATISSWTTTCP
jgi:predicted phosphodiesterase